MIGSRCLRANTPVIVQGITGRMGRTHAALMRAYGTNIVGGTSTRTDTTEAAGVPVFANCRDAVLATGAIASVAMAPPLETLAAVEEALAAGIRLIVTVAEGIPLHDALKIGRAVRRAGATWIGGSTPGMAIPGEIKLGFLPDVCLRPGPFAIMSKSGTLSYEVRLPPGAWQASARASGSASAAIQVKGVRFADLLPVFFADPTHPRHHPGRRGRRQRGRGMRRRAGASRRAQAGLRADRRARGEGGRVDGPRRRAGAGRGRHARLQDADA